MEYYLLLACCIACILLESSHTGKTFAESKAEALAAPHGGSTVTAMLAKLGLGPLAYCGSGEKNDYLCSELALKDHLPVCWGYEKDCAKEEALFVPQCEPPAKPWYENIRK